jgi:hypothetical protein
LTQVELSDIQEKLNTQLVVHEQVQTESNELRARFEYAAQEINKQEKVIDDLKEGERIRVASGSDDQDLMREMNALLEGKIEAEARADKAETDSTRLQDQLSTYDRNAAQEQDIIMKAAEIEMEAMRNAMAKREEAFQVMFMVCYMYISINVCTNASNTYVH